MKQKSRTDQRALLKQSERDASVTPMDAVLDAAQSGTFTDDHGFRLLARLSTLKRMMYYVYGGWAQGTNLNEYPPAVAYLFGKQTYDESPTRCSFAMKCYGVGECCTEIVGQWSHPDCFRSSYPRCSLARRQQTLVTFFRYGRELGCDQRPAIAVVLAAKNFTAGGAAEDRAAAVRFF